MQPQTGYIHVSYDACRVKPRENITQFVKVFSNHSARVVVFVKAFQPFVNIDRIISDCNALRNGRQPSMLLKYSILDRIPCEPQIGSSKTGLWSSG
jgi:hypothetical protein